MSRKFHSGRFIPKNPNKYVGDASNIIYRSSWERKLLIYLDSQPAVLNYSSEELIIPYISPIDNKYHRYFPDIVAKVKKKDGTTQTIVIEVKPKSQTVPPTKRNSKKYLTEVATYGVNQAKWKAAEEFCKDRNWQFVIFTEEQLNIK